jgi:DNA-binding transcriptional ArsR family regulator
MKRRAANRHPTAHEQSLDALHPIRSLEALRVVTDNRRHSILSLLIREPLAAGEIAAALRLPRTRVYHHLKLLEQHRFIRVVERRPVGKRIEMVYRAAARNFRIDSALINRAGPAVARERARLLESTLDDFRSRLVTRARGADKRETLVGRKLVRLTAAQYLELRRRLMQLFDEVDASQDEGELVELTIALFPVCAAPQRPTS